MSARKIVVYRLGMFASLAVFGLVVAYWWLGRPAGRTEDLTVIAFIASSLAISVFGMRYWALIDEAAKEAHKWAWMWGGSVGAGAFLGFLAGSRAGSGSPIDLIRNDQFIAGVVACYAVQLIGYGLAWAYWWLRRR